MKIRNFIQCAAAAALLVGTTAPTFAQKKSKSDGAAPAFDKGSKTLGLGIGLGGVYSLGFSRSFFPTLYATYDHGIVGNVGPGTIGIGGVVGFRPVSYGSSLRETNLLVGARGTYHLTILKDKNNKFDPYGGAMLGMVFRNYNDGLYSNSAYFVPGFFLGAKYNFKPKFGAWAEVGYDYLSYLRLGINFNF